GIDSPYAPGAASQVAASGKVAYAPLQLTKRQDDVKHSTVTAIKQAVAGTNGSGLQVELGGQVFAKEPTLGPAELIGIVAAIIVLLVVFGSVLAMGLPILTALFGIGVALGVVQLLSHVVSTPNFTTQLASMIGIGVGIDYALFIVTRYRRGIDQGWDPERA